MYAYGENGWPITWFTADQQWNCVNCVVRRSSIHLPLRAGKLASVIWPTHTSQWPFLFRTAVWIKPLSEECSHEWKQRYSILVWQNRATSAHWGQQGTVAGGQFVWKWQQGYGWGFGYVNWRLSAELHFSNCQSLLLSKMSGLSTHPSHWSILLDTADLCFMDCELVLDVQFSDRSPLSGLSRWSWKAQISDGIKYKVYVRPWLYSPCLSACHMHYR